MRRSKYEVMPGECTPDILVIRDAGGTMDMTVTNDAENVVIDLVKRELLKRGMRLFYYDSEGTKDEILFDDRGFFRGFATTHEREPSTIRILVSKAQHQHKCKAPNLIIEACAETIPDFGTVQEGWEQKSRDWFSTQARGIVDALAKTLPGGTMIAMLRYMLLAHGNHWRVPLIQLPIEQVGDWRTTVELIEMGTKGCGHWWMARKEFPTIHVEVFMAPLKGRSPLMAIRYIADPGGINGEGAIHTSLMTSVKYAMFKRDEEPDLPECFRVNPNTGDTPVDEANRVMMANEVQP